MRDVRPQEADENFLYVFKGARFAVAGGRPPRRAGHAACPVRSRHAGPASRQDEAEKLLSDTWELMRQDARG
ncbi:hypothetical protein DMH08_17525 [Actinomadura sp. WAC 06369]|nr:hypothetical protein DMH08_17525 [Actinomadura sp. WAC 06369]